eukprot:2146075-Amphidinium_carterae.1
MRGQKGLQIDGSDGASEDKGVLCKVKTAQGIATVVALLLVVVVVGVAASIALVEVWADGVWKMHQLALKVGLEQPA